MKNSNWHSDSYDHDFESRARNSKSNPKRDDSNDNGEYIMKLEDLFNDKSSSKRNSFPESNSQPRYSQKQDNLYYINKEDPYQDDYYSSKNNARNSDRSHSRSDRSDTIINTGSNGKRDIKSNGRSDTRSNRFEEQHREPYPESYRKPHHEQRREPYAEPSRSPYASSNVQKYPNDYNGRAYGNDQDSEYEDWFSNTGKVKGTKTNNRKDKKAEKAVAKNLDAFYGKKKQPELAYYDDESTNNRKQYKSKGGHGFLIAVIFIIAITGGCFLLAKSYTAASLNAPKEPVAIADGKGIEVTIPLGATTNKIAEILQEKGFINYPTIYKFMSKMNGKDGLYKSGVYTLSMDMDYDQIMSTLVGKPSTNPGVKVMIPEGKAFIEIVNLLVEKKLGSKEKFIEAAKADKFKIKALEGISPEVIKKRKYQLEGYLFPETYDFTSSMSEEQIVSLMVNQFEKVVKPEFYQKLTDLNTALKLNLTMDQIIIMASLIEKEAATDKDRPLVASVFYNRLKSKSYPLFQSCATVQYILLNRNGVIKTELTNAETGIDDPYNTYKISGLPPGPICMPSQASIVAALSPDTTQYLFFVAKGDGEHIFSKTLTEHNRAVVQVEKAAKQQ